MSAGFLPDLPPALRRRLMMMAAGSAVLLAIAEFGYGGLVGSWTADARRQADMARDEVAALQRSAAMRRQDEAREGTDGEVADFLTRMEQAAAGAGAHILRMAPKPQEPGMFEFEIAADFPSLLGVVTAIERSGHAIRRLSTGSAAEAGGGLSARLLVDARDGVPLSGPYVDGLFARVADGTLRDPTLPAGTSAFDRLPALPGDHRLTAISRVGATAWATIDNVDYRTGQRLGEAEIVDIETDAVVFSDGRRRLVLRLARGN